jgi:hypothetical protein
MKKLLVLSSALLVFSASLASAQVNLSWNNCYGVGLAAANKNYACDGSSVGNPFKLVMSFKNVIEMSAFVGTQCVIDVQTSAPVLPDYWRFSDGECRVGVIGYPAPLIGIGTGAAGACQDVWSDVNSAGGFDWTTGFGGPARGRLRTVFARQDPRPLAYGTGAIAGVITIDPYGDVDTGDGHVCVGCQVPGCLVLNSVEVFQVAGTPPTDQYAISGGNPQNWVTWQGGDPSCVGATPAKNKSWGSVKALYR